MSTILELKGLTKTFGGLTAVGNVDFRVEKDSITGLIGPNGAGKTTIFNLITGVYKVSSGNIIFEGKDIANKEPYMIADAGITRTFQNIRLFKKLTVYENVLTACHFNADYTLLDSVIRLPKFKKQEKALKDQAGELLKIMGLDSRKDLVANNLPYGLQRRLEIARALALRPKLLLLDEPAAGMNPEETEQLMTLISEIRTKFNLTILIIEHHMDLIMGVCENIMVLNFGCKLAEGTPREVQNNKSVIEAYLGVEV
ncbi:MAG TPA: ABC transporter ATP-binding protein [Negativicutes bacterium]|nr:ABC transporter ATP-binding protein [Negativicutes bacterium]